MKTERKKLRLNKKFRFQLLANWISEHYKPCKVADIGGGKGLLAYLLNQKGFSSCVIDPVEKVSLPTKYKDYETKGRIKLSESDFNNVPRISERFEERMSKDFDLLVGLHAHGSNMKIIQAAKRYDKRFILLPCCVVDEPIEIKPNIDWLESLFEYAKEMGFDVKRDKLNFKGQNILIYF